MRGTYQPGRARESRAIGKSPCGCGDVEKAPEWQALQSSLLPVLARALLL
jgi:hypothetical protein